MTAIQKTNPLCGLTAFSITVSLKALRIGRVARQSAALAVPEVGPAVSCRGTCIAENATSASKQTHLPL